MGFDEAYARELVEAGLDEVRFNVKLDELRLNHRENAERMWLCAGLLEDVVAEMRHAQPGGRLEVKQFLVRLDGIS